MGAWGTRKKNKAPSWISRKNTKTKQGGGGRKIINTSAG